MSNTLITDGTQTAVIGTEHTLATVTSIAKTLILKVDCFNMTSGDTVEVRCKDKVLATSPLRQAWIETMTGVQTDLVFITVPAPSLHGTSFTVKQTTGTGRAFPWSLMSLD